MSATDLVVTQEAEGEVLATITDVPDQLVRPSIDCIVDSIIIEMHAANEFCTPALAKEFVDWIDEVVDTIRDWRSQGLSQEMRYYALSKHEIDKYHPVLEVVMIDDDLTPAEGSVHALLNARVVADDELGLLHSKQGEPTAVYCVVGIEMRSIG